MTEQIDFTISPIGVGSITFSNPPHNAMTGTMLGEITRLVNESSENQSVKVLVIKSSGERTFCAGASFDELMSIKNDFEGKVFFSGFALLINAIRKCKKIVLGQVQGKVVGGGVGLASAFDLCFASRFADIKLSEISIGIGPAVISPAVIRKIGLSAFSQLSLNPQEFKSANWALEKGLFSSLSEIHGDLNNAVTRKASELCDSNPEALSNLKRSFWTGCDDWDVLLMRKAEESGKLVLSDFTQKALSRFKK